MTVLENSLGTFLLGGYVLKICYKRYAFELKFGYFEKEKISE